MAKSPDLLIHSLRAMLDPARQETAPDGDLLARWVAAGDARAFAALVWRHGALVWRVSRGILAHPEDAQDVFQATYFVLAKKAPTLQHRASIAGWLHETAHRLALKARTASGRRLRRESQAEQKPPVDPLEELSVREPRAILDEELQRLPAPDHDALLLCLYEGATQEEAARQLRCSLSTLKRRLDRGRASLI
jgi:RNA polymerase sigma factor (sigma-70 family)